MTELADYSGASTSRQAYERARKKALLNDPGSWSYKSFADWKKRHSNAVAQNRNAVNEITVNDQRVQAGQ